MTIVKIFVLLIGLLLVAFMGIALHLARTIEMLRQYISELERDMRIANDKLMDHDTATDHQ